ncbi:hypothetical protein HZU77_006925 [Neisseriaceae bacterium TC5R-5]|nr:hypothetical protein [Neisseriaceae bacterium TC5R-5]
MMQTCLQSLIETCVSTAIGFIVALGAQVFITHWFGIRTSLHQDVGIVVFFTFISLLRGYLIRRTFNWLHGRSTPGDIQG